MLDKDVAIIGAGRVGTSIGVLLQRAGVRVIGCVARTPETLERTIQFLSCPSSTRIEDVLPGAEFILIAVPDRKIPEVVEVLSSHGLSEGTVVIHVAGSVGLKPLSPLEHVGAEVAAVHVLQAIPSIEAGIERIPGSWFGATCHPGSESLVEDYVSIFNGSLMWVPENQRVLYHAAAVISSNYLVALASIAEKVGSSADPFLGLMGGTLANLSMLGIENALTGPIVRGDTNTVKAHIEALDGLENSSIGPLYRQLGRTMLSLAVEFGRIDDSTASEMASLLKES